MIHPAPTTKVEPGIARGVFEGVPMPGMIAIGFPNTSYQTHLRCESPIAAQVGDRIVGVIRCQARRVDVVGAGGKYLEPVIGRPRRVQGRVMDAPTREGCIVIDAGAPLHCELTDPRQRPGDFAPGVMVTFDVPDGASFQPLR